MSTINDLERILENNSKIPLPCVLCGTITHMRGVFEPNPETPIGQRLTLGKKPGKTRFIIYAICPGHAMNEETLTRVEDAIFHEFTNTHEPSQGGSQ